MARGGGGDDGDARRESEQKYTLDGELTDLERRELRLPMTIRAADNALNASVNARVVAHSAGSTSRVDAMQATFVGRGDTLKRLHAHAASDETPNVLLLEGEQGVGMSSVLGRFVIELETQVERMIEHEETTGEVIAEKKPYVLHESCRGPMPKSCDLQHMLWTMCERLHRKLGKTVYAPMPTTAKEAGACFRHLCQEVAVTTSSVVVVVIDGLDNVAGLDDVDVADWLPAKMATDVRFIIGAHMRGEAVRYIINGGENAAPLVRKRLPQLSTKERHELARALFSHPDERHISADAFEIVASYKDAGSPSYMYLAAHEVRRRVKVANRRPEVPTDANSEIRNLPQTFEQLLPYIFEGLQHDYGSEAVRELMVLLLSSRAGMLTRELQEVSNTSRSALVALIDDIAHMCWGYDTGPASVLGQPDLMILRSSHVIDYAKRQFIDEFAKAGQFQREAVLFYLRNFHDTRLEFDIRQVNEVFHILRVGKWPMARDTLQSYMTDPQVLHFMWKEQYIGELVSCWKHLASEEGTRDAMATLVHRLTALNDRTLELVTESLMDFFSWMGSPSKAITVCKVASERPSFEQRHSTSVSMKYGRTLRRIKDWKASLEHLRVAEQRESANYNGNTPIGAIIHYEQSLSYARTAQDELSLENHELRGPVGQVEVAINDAISSGSKALETWQMVSRGEIDIDEALFNEVSVMKSLATLYHLKEDFKQEISMHMKAVETLESQLDVNHYAIHDELIRLARAYKENGDWQQAEFCLEQSLSHVVDNYAEDSLTLFESLRALAEVYTAKGEFASAREICEDAYQKASQVVDAVQRPLFVEFTIEIVDLLAQIALKSGSLDEAKKHAIKALNMTKERFGEIHPETAKRLSDLAKVHLALKNYDQAKALHIKALDVDTKTMDDQNPALAERHMDIARVDMTREQPKEAMQSLAVARLVLDNVTEVEFPELAARLNSVGEMYMTLGQMEKAEPLFVQAVDIAERDHHSHRCLATYATNLATLCVARGRPVKALEYFTTALELEEKKHGEMHLDVARACVRVGQVLFDMEEWKDADVLYTRAMRIRSQKLGEDHDETLSCAKMVKLAKERERSQHATGIVQATVAKYEDITAKSAENTPNHADKKPSEFAESKEKATPASADKTVTTMQRALQKLALLTDGAAERNKREAEERRQSASKAQHLAEHQNRIEELDEKTRSMTISRASEEPQKSKPPAVAEKQQGKLHASPDESDRTFEISQKKHLPKLKGPVPVDEPKESMREKQRLIASPERQKRKLPRLITSPRKEEEKTDRANFEEKKAAQSGDMNAFLSEYVEYSGHQRYRFKLDGMTMPSFRQIRQYVEANFQDECRRWSVGENVERVPEPVPVKVVEEVPLRASPPSRRVVTEPEPTKKSPRSHRIFSEAPIVESPVSENTAPVAPAQQPQLVIETTPQSKSAFGSPAPPVRNDVPALASEQYRMMFAKIDTLEKQLAETKAIMQRLLYDRTLASPPQYLPPPPPPPPPLAIDYHQPMVARPMDTGYTMNDGYSMRESEYFPTRTNISPRYALMYTPAHHDSFSPTSLNRTSPHKPASRKLCRL